MYRRWLVFLTVVLLIGVLRGTAVGQETFLPPNLAPITIQNVNELTEVATIGYGGVGQVFWMPDEETLAVKNGRGLWLHDTDDLSIEPRLIAENVGGQAWISPDGLRLGIWKNFTLEIWDIKNDEIIATWQLPGRTNSVRFSNDWSFFVTGSATGPEYFPNHGVVTVLDTATGEELNGVITQNDTYPTPIISADSRYVLTETNIIDMKSGEVSEGGGILSPDGQVIAIQRDNQMIDLIRFGTQEVLTQIKHDHQYVSLVFSPDSQFLLIRDESQNLEVWEVNSGERIYKLEKGENSSLSISAISPDSRIMALMDGEAVRLYEIASGDEIGTLPVSGNIYFSPNGRQIATMSADNGLQLWDSTMIKLVDENPRYFDVGSVVTISEDGSVLATWSVLNSFKIWDVQTGTLVSTLEYDSSSADAVILSPDGQKLYVGNTGITVWDIKTGEYHTFAEDHRSIHDLAMSSDGRFLASASGWVYGGCEEECPPQDNSVRLWDVTTEMQLAAVSSDNTDNPFTRVAMSADGTLLAASFAGLQLNLWKVTDLLQGISEPSAIIYGDDSISDTTFSADNSMVAVAYDILYPTEGGVFVLTHNLATAWDVNKVLLNKENDMQDQAMSFRICCQVGANQVAFSFDGSLVATGGADLRLWDTNPIPEDTNQEPIKTIETRKFVFSRDGRLLITTGDNGGIHFWGIPN